MLPPLHPHAEASVGVQHVWSYLSQCSQVSVENEGTMTFFYNFPFFLGGGGEEYLNVSHKEEKVFEFLIYKGKKLFFAFKVSWMFFVAKTKVSIT